MKIKYYGTSAGGGIPEIFCSCRICMHARAVKGKNIRTRSQAVIDDRLSLDYSVDTFCHTAFGGLDMRNIHHVLITHAHHDHFLVDDVFSRHQGVSEPIQFYASEKSGAALRRKNDALGELYRSGSRVRTSDFRVEVNTLEMFKSVEILEYTVTPLRARHAESIDAMIFLIQNEGKSVLWAHDTGKFPSDTMQYLKNSGIVLDLVSLDCTLKRGEQITKSHMDLDWDIEMLELLRKNGNLNDNTRAIISHIGHLVEKTHGELSREAAEYGIEVAYDGMEIEI